MPHIHDKIDFTASVFVVNGDAVLLRLHEKYHKWLQVGGHVELDEDPNEAAVREAKEESGLMVTLVGDLSHAMPEIPGSKDIDLLPPRYINRHTVGNGHEHVDLIYFATSATRDLAPRPEEGDVQIRWFTLAELDDPQYDMYPSTRYYAKAALAALS